jgi:hypothetical protein
MGFLSSEELKQLLPAETSAFPSPIPTQSVSSDEFMPRRKPKSSASSRRGSRNTAASWHAIRA